MADSEFVLKPRPPVRAYLTAAVASLLGAALLVLAGSMKWHWVVSAIGWVLLVAGVLLAVAALLAVGRLTTRFVLGDEGYRLLGPAGVQEGTWADVTRVTQSSDGSVVTIHRGDEARDRLVFSSADDSQVQPLLEEMGRRLDTAKGYTPFN